MPAEEILTVRDLTKSFGTTYALAGLTCSVHRGEVVGLLGPNGAGKTTTMRLLLGLLRPTSGSATILGRDCTREAIAIKRLIGYVPDEPAFYDFLSGRETIDFVLAVRGIDAGAAWPRIEKLIALLDFEGQLDTMVGGYSHGMKKKLALLVALAHEPKVLLLDEPTNGLDPPTAHRVRELFREIAADGAAILLSTHLLDMADRLCDRMLLLDRGKLVAQGTRDSIRVRAAVPKEGTLEDAFLALVR
jgi:ABC-type multidrug transport system ATPase subunit